MLQCSFRSVRAFIRCSSTSSSSFFHFSSSHFTRLTKNVFALFSLFSSSTTFVTRSILTDFFFCCSSSSVLVTLAHVEWWQHYMVVSVTSNNASVCVCERVVLRMPFMVPTSVVPTQIIHSRSSYRLVCSINKYSAQLSSNRSENNFLAKIVRLRETEFLFLKFSIRV